MKRLAIIGGGPSGLITLKFAVEYLSDWEIVCFEQQDGFLGAWGKTHSRFVSTSTKYTTQFACFQQFDTRLRKSDATTDEFFNADEYGDYLDDFVGAFGLAKHVRLNCRIASIKRSSDTTSGWHVAGEDLASGAPINETFSHLVVCTGLANRFKQFDTAPDATIKTLTRLEQIEFVRNRRVIVFGGGESGVDLAERLSEPSRNNTVFLSLRSGIRVSPRYHPIRNVPSDFLRNRLLMSFHEDIRNSIGQRFVEFRIRFESLLNYVFRSRQKTALENRTLQQFRADWNQRINRLARGKLFNMFHNKSDDFLTSAAAGRIRIVGPNRDSAFRRFWNLEQTESFDIEPELLVPAVGFESRLTGLLCGEFRLSDFHLGCVHKTDTSIYLVGFSRPIIGNIPTIAEMQARYVTGLIAGRYRRVEDLADLHKLELETQRQKYPAIDVEAVHPVDMFPYCDRLAAVMKIYPRWKDFRSVRKWINFWLAPATTGQYLDGWKNDQGRASRSNAGSNSQPLELQPVFTPTLLNGLMLLIKPIDCLYRRFGRS